MYVCIPPKTRWTSHHKITCECVCRGEGEWGECVYVRVCVCMYEYMCTYVYVYEYLCVYVSTCVC